MNQTTQPDIDGATGLDPVQRFCDEMSSQGIGVKPLSPSPLPPAHLIEMVRPEDWAEAAAVARDQAFRYVAGWAEDEGSLLSVSICLELAGTYLVLRTRTDGLAPSVPSYALYFASADRPERHMRD